MQDELAFLAAAAGWGIDLAQGQREDIARYLALLIENNRKVNLTADTDPRVLLLRHVADGLAAVPVLKDALTSPAPRIVDLGAGGGFIGIAIKIAWPEARVTLMESLKRKYDFLNVAAARLSLKGLRVVRRSAGKDALAAGDRDFDAVVARALAPLPEALALGLPLAAPGGLFAAYQSDPPHVDDEVLKRALEKASGMFVGSVPYRLPLESRDRHLALFRRETGTRAL